MKRFKCKKCGREVTLISGIYPSPQEEDSGEYKEETYQAATFECPKCGLLSYDKVEKMEVSTQVCKNSSNLSYEMNLHSSMDTLEKIED